MHLICIKFWMKLRILWDHFYSWTPINVHISNFCWFKNWDIISWVYVSGLLNYKWQKTFQTQFSKQTIEIECTTNTYRESIHVHVQSKMTCFYVKTLILHTVLGRWLSCPNLPLICKYRLMYLQNIVIYGNSRST